MAGHTKSALFEGGFPLSKIKLSGLISFFLLATLSVESVPLPVRAQILPLASLLAVLVLPFVINRIRATPLLKVVAIFVFFVLLHSVIALFIDVTTLGAGEARVLAWARQVIALVMGLSVFLVLRGTLINVSDRFIVYSVIVGALLALAVALLNVLWGLTGNAFASSIVTSIRSTLIPAGFTAASRASGLSTEPAHFAFYLAIIVLPIALGAYMLSKRRLRWLVILIFILIAFAWTLSTTGLIVLLSLVLAGILLGPRRKLFVTTAVVALAFVAGLMILFPNNYAAFQVGRLFSGDWSLSIIARFYSTFGPVIKALSSYTLLGYGLGGTSSHFGEIVPAFAQPYIAAVRWKGAPNLGSLIGRLLAETGLIGLCLFAVIIFFSLRELEKSIHHRSISSSRVYLLKVARLALLAFLFGASIGHGSLASPYLWVWLAFIDSRYILNKLR